MRQSCRGTWQCTRGCPWPFWGLAGKIQFDISQGLRSPVLAHGAEKRGGIFLTCAQVTPWTSGHIPILSSWSSSSLSLSRVIFPQHCLLGTEVPPSDFTLSPPPALPRFGFLSVHPRVPSLGAGRLRDTGVLAGRCTSFQRCREAFCKHQSQFRPPEDEHVMWLMLDYSCLS